MTKALWKDFFVEIKKSLNRFISIFLIVAMGVAFFSGIRASEPDMRYSADEYFDQHNVMDIKILGTMGITKDDVDYINGLNHVSEAIGAYSIDLYSKINNTQSNVRILSTNEDINKIEVVSGRLPNDKGECIIDDEYAINNNLSIGDKITFFNDADDELSDKIDCLEYEIVGTGVSPLFFSIQKGSTTIGDGSLDAYIYVTPENFTYDVYTELYVCIEGIKNTTIFTNEYEDILEKFKDDLDSVAQDRCDKRYNDIIDEAKEELSEAKREYNDGLDSYNEEYDEAYEKLKEAYDTLTTNKEKINNGLKDLDTKETELQSALDLVNKGYSDYESGLLAYNTGLENYNTLCYLASQGIESGYSDEQLDSMKASLDQNKAILETTKNQLDQNKGDIEEGIATINRTRNQLLISKNQIDDGFEEYYENEENAKEEFAEAKAKLEEAKVKIDEAANEIDSIKEPEWIINDRTSISYYKECGENADRIKSIGKVFPVIFFLVAALISLTTMTRMVEEQRTLIGTLKALGYGKMQIATKYILYALLATTLGSILGILVGEKILPYVIITAYQIVYPRMTNVVVPYNLYYGFMASLAAILCTLIATIASCYKELASNPAKLMRPVPPKNGKRILLEHLTFLWKKMSFSQKSTFRNLMRYKKRFFMTVFGIGACMALMIVGYGIRDSIFDIAILQYDEIQRFDGMIVLNNSASDSEKEKFDKFLNDDEKIKDYMSVLMENTCAYKDSKTSSLNAYLVVPEDMNHFIEYTTFRDRKSLDIIKPSDNGVLITEKMSKLLDVKEGDSISIEYDNETVNVKVTGIVENYMSHYIYMSKDLYEQTYDKTIKENMIYFKASDSGKSNLDDMGSDILKHKACLGVSYMKDIRKQLDDMLSSMNIVIIVLIISAGLLAFVVLYNLNNININERRRELASLKVLGFYDLEVANYVYKENIWLTLIGAILGVFLGKVLHAFIITTVEIDTCMFSRNIYNKSFIYSLLFTLGFSILVNVLMFYKLRKIDMVESLKSVE